MIPYGKTDKFNKSSVDNYSVISHLNTFLINTI